MAGTAAFVSPSPNLCSPPSSFLASPLFLTPPTSPSFSFRGVFLALYLQISCLSYRACPVMFIYTCKGKGIEPKWDGTHCIFTSFSVRSKPSIGRLICLKQSSHNNKAKFRRGSSFCVYFSSIRTFSRPSDTNSRSATILVRCFFFH